jgi:formylglycine-generating enzyme required for sulfatase activity
MRQLFLLISFVPLFISDVIADDSLSFQKFTITARKGIVDIWSKEKTRWEVLKDSSCIDIGKTVATKDNSELQLTFEPAIFTTVKQNSVLSLEKLIVSHSQKTIRMLMRLQTGEILIRAPQYSGYTLLFTLTTPSAVIYINNADIALQVDNDITKVKVKRGEVKIEHINSQVKSIVYSGCEASVSIGKPVVQIAPIDQIKADEKKSVSLKNQKSEGPSIAILSIQSKNIGKESLDRVSDLVAEEYQHSSNAKVLYLEEIREMLRAEDIKGLLECYTDSCISKIGSFLGVDMVILGNMGQLGESYIFTLKMVDVLRDKVLKRTTTTVDGDLGLVLKRIPDMVNGLVSTQDSVVEKEQEIAVDTSKSGPNYRELYTWISGGSFTMGLENSADNFDAVPRHKVTLSSFFMDKYEVTKEEFEKVMGYNPSTFRGCSKCPIENVSWKEADQYCKKLGMHLPTEAQWEYACRAGTETAFHYGNSISSEQANFDGRNPYGGIPAGQFRNKTVPVGSYQPNKWGLYDMHGNVAEWCSDWYDPSYYGNSSEKDPAGPSKGKLKVVRGGSWNNGGSALLSGKRSAFNPELKLSNIGFRCVKDDKDSSLTK